MARNFSVHVMVDRLGSYPLPVTRLPTFACPYIINVPDPNQNLYRIYGACLCR